MWAAFASNGGVVSRKKEFPDVFSARFRAGTAAAIDAVLADGESPADFVRIAVAAEIDRRRRKGRRQGKPEAAETAEVPTKTVPPEAVDWCAKITASEGDS